MKTQVDQRKTMKIESLSRKTDKLVRKCLDCGASMLGSPRSYIYKECGLKSVELLNVVVYECQHCHETVPEIPAVDQLHAVIAINLLLKDSLLSGEEIRFLRKMASLTQAELSEVLGVTPTRPSKWESNEENIGAGTDRALRACCLIAMAQQHTTGEDPMPLMREIREFVRQMDVQEIFKGIRSKAEGPKQVKIRHSGSTVEPWLLPVKGRLEQHVQ